MKIIISSFVILLTVAYFVFANNHDYYMRDNIFYDVEYRDLFIEELKKRNIKYLTNKNNPNHLAVESNNSGRIEEVSKIALSKTSQHIFSDCSFKDKFLKKLDENNIPYVENIISKNPPDCRVRLNEKDLEKANLLFKELIE